MSSHLRPSPQEIRLPFYPDAEARIKANVLTIKAGGWAPLIAIGAFTDTQVAGIDAARQGLGRHDIADKEAVFIGRRLYPCRVKDGYAIDDICRQIDSALGSGSAVNANPKITAMQNPRPRDEDTATRQTTGPFSS